MKITTWSDVQMQISLHKLPYSVLRFNMSLTGVLIDTATGDTLACTIRDAAHVIQGAAAPPSTSVTSETPKPLGLQMADDIASALMPKRSTSISLSPAEVLAVDLMGKQAKAARGVNGFDYKHQAWVKDGVYLRCGHPALMPGCVCYGRLHEGEPVAADADIQ